MRLRRLRVRHFRNLGLQELVFPPEGVAVIGGNAEGKTNLLEGIYYLETFRSFRGARDDQLVAFDEDVFRLVGTLEGSPARETEVAAAFQRTGRRKKVTVDGAEVPRLSDGLGRLAAVVFSPSDIAIVSEGPAERRRFLDIVLSLNEPGYLEALQAFRSALSQRNAALREEEPEAAVRAWDEPLIGSGARVVHARKSWIEARNPTFRSFYGRISGGAEAGMSYDPSVDLDGAETEEEVKDAFGAHLRRTARREAKVGNTVVGPHRDEVVFSLEGERPELEVREFGSGGQRRTAALALRLVEAATVRDAREQDPLVLMDDVFAELDPDRSERILDLIEGEEAGQVILTAPKESDVRLRESVLPRWRIRDGRVEA